MLQIRSPLPLPLKANCERLSAHLWPFEKHWAKENAKYLVNSDSLSSSSLCLHYLSVPWILTRIMKTNRTVQWSYIEEGGHWPLLEGMAVPGPAQQPRTLSSCSRHRHRRQIWNQKGGNICWGPCEGGLPHHWRDTHGNSPLLCLWALIIMRLWLLVSTSHLVSMMELTW